MRPPLNLSHECVADFLSLSLSLSGLNHRVLWRLHSGGSQALLQSSGCVSKRNAFLQTTGSQRQVHKQQVPVSSQRARSCWRGNTRVSSTEDSENRINPTSKDTSSILSTFEVFLLQFSLKITNIFVALMLFASVSFSYVNL